METAPIYVQFIGTKKVRASVLVIWTPYSAYRYMCMDFSDFLINLPA